MKPKQEVKLLDDGRVQCPCGASTWSETWIGCDTCGDHQGAVCQACGESVDLVFLDRETTDALRDIIDP